MKKKKRKNKFMLIGIFVILIISTVFIINNIIKKKNSNAIKTDSNIYETAEVKEIIDENNQEKETKEETRKNNQNTVENSKEESKKNSSAENEKNNTSKKSSSTKSSNKKNLDEPIKKEEITYIKGVLLVNKKYTLPKTYNPGVNSTAKSAFNKMKEGAAKDGISLKIVSDFRSYNTQKAIYSKNLNKHGEKIANRFSAKAGQSEHQTGLAFDLNKANRTFVGTKEAQWLAKNCYKYGFIIRYPEGKESITGYVYEPWHVRYVGCEIAKEIYNRGICLEEYLGVN